MMPEIGQKEAYEASPHGSHYIELQYQSAVGPLVKTLSEQRGMFCCSTREFYSTAESPGAIPNEPSCHLCDITFVSSWVVCCFGGKFWKYRTKSELLSSQTQSPG